MRLTLFCLLALACSFQVEGLHVDPASPAGDPTLAPAPLPPASSLSEAPDLANAAPDPARAPDLAPAPVVCVNDCRVDVPGGAAETRSEERRVGKEGRCRLTAVPQ